jgi:hypothetical protein
MSQVTGGHLSLTPARHSPESRWLSEEPQLRHERRAKGRHKWGLMPGVRSLTAHVVASTSLRLPQLHHYEQIIGAGANRSKCHSGSCHEGALRKVTNCDKTKH